MPNYIALAIPFFFMGIGVEVWAARRRGVSVYRFTDATIDLSTGITQQVSLIFMKGAQIAAYIWIYDHWRFITPQASVWTWLLALLGVDFVYYWWHRLSHEVNFLWAAHVVHHSSEDYNLAVALRQAILTTWTALPFHLSLAFFGVPPLVTIGVDSINTLYQFWIHTELVGKLGWFERLFNTPSHHRVHHGINPRYLDKNYAGIFIFWDRIFGTFEEESEPVVYGLVKPLGSYNPLWAQFHYWVQLARISWAAPRPIDKLRIWLKPPPWLPEGLPAYPRPPEVRPESFQKYDPQIGPALSRYVFVQLALTVCATTLLLFNEARLSPALAGVGSTLIIATLVIWGGLFEGRRWAVGAELIRLSALFVLAVALWGPVAASAGVILAGMALWMLRISRAPVPMGVTQLS